jgi:hypothetical protein
MGLYTTKTDFEYATITQDVGSPKASMPPYVVTSYFWQVVDHWQALIAGIFALVAGGAAYLAGTQQANATRQAAKQQVEATERAAKQQVATVNAELEHLKSEKAEEDRRAREDLLAALDTEAARIPLLVQLKCDVDGTRQGQTRLLHRQRRTKYPSGMH